MHAITSSDTLSEYSNEEEFFPLQIKCLLDIYHLEKAGQEINTSFKNISHQQPLIYFSILFKRRSAGVSISMRWLFLILPQQSLGQHMQCPRVIPLTIVSNTNRSCISFLICDKKDDQ